MGGKRARPPPAPLLSRTWHSVAAQTAGAACAVEIQVVGGAMLATEAKRRRGLLQRERYALLRSCKATALQKRRLRALEHELASIVQGVERCKRRALGAAAAAGSAARAA